MWHERRDMGIETSPVQYRKLATSQCLMIFSFSLPPEPQFACTSESQSLTISTICACASGEEFCFRRLLDISYTIHQMDIQNTVNLMMDDLVVVARFDPNERLPKEEQIRCSIYAAIRPLFEVVCAERGYASIDEGGRTEADLFAYSSGGTPVWIEFKRCWWITGWNNKPPAQLEGWEADVAKLRSLPIVSDRYFVLVGMFDGDPLATSAIGLRKLTALINDFYPQHMIFSTVRNFSWRQGDGVTHLAAWVWRWSAGQSIAGFSGL